MYLLALINRGWEIVQKNGRINELKVSRKRLIIETIKKDQEWDTLTKESLLLPYWPENGRFLGLDNLDKNQEVTLRNFKVYIRLLGNYKYGEVIMLKHLCDFRNEGVMATTNKKPMIFSNWDFLQK